MKTATYPPTATGFLLKRVALMIALCFTVGQAAFAQTGAVTCPANIDFSSNSFSNWTCFTGSSSAGILHPDFQNIANSGPVGGTLPTASPAVVTSTSRHAITSGTAIDYYGGFSMVAPGGGLYSSIIGNSNTGYSAERIRYVVHVPVGFNNYSFDYKYAFVLNNGGHTDGEQPSFIVEAYDSAAPLAPLVCASHYYTVNASANPGLQTSSVNSGVNYLPWTNGNMNLSGYGGRTIYLDVTSYDCAQGGHFGYGYFDVISCGRFAATITQCNLATGIATLAGPSGYATYKWYSSSWTYLGAGSSINRPVPATPDFFYCILTPYGNGGCPDTIRTRTLSNFTVSTTPKAACNSLGNPISILVTPTGGTGGFTYSWYTDPTLSCLTCNNPTARPVGASTYIVQVSDSTGCYRMDTVRVENPSFHVNVGPDLVTCLGTSVNINPTITPASAGYVFHWMPGNNLSDSTTINTTYTPAGVGYQQLILRVDSSICATADTLVIRTLPNTFSTFDTAVCQGEKFNAHVEGDTAFLYTWSPLNVPFINYSSASHTQSRNPLITADSTITYTIKANYPTCPTYTKTLTVRVEPQPIVQIGTGADTVDKCLYQPLYLTANVQPTWYTNYTYQWRANEFIDNTTSPIIAFTGRTDTTLRITVRTPLGCRGRDSVRIRVYQSGFGHVTPNDTAICPHNNFQLTATGGVTYRWTPSLYLSDTAGSTVTANPGTTTSYIVYVTDKNQCTDTVPVTLHVFAEASVNVPDSITIYPGETYQLSPVGNALYYSWFPTVGLSNAGLANPVASPSVNTLYSVTGTTEAGCVATDSIHVIVKDDAAIDMPNAFSPGSAPNAMFSVAHQGLATLKYFRIFNRWGTKVFETSDINQGWDGRYNGEPQPLGVYIYTIEATTAKGNAFIKQGNITLIR